LTLYRYAQAVGVSLERIMAWAVEDEMRSEAIERELDEVEALA
jgi:hypothetical protein